MTRVKNVRFRWKERRKKKGNERSLTSSQRYYYYYYYIEVQVYYDSREKERELLIRKRSDYTMKHNRVLTVSPTPRKVHGWRVKAASDADVSLGGQLSFFGCAKSKYSEAGNVRFLDSLRVRASVFSLRYVSIQVIEKRRYR